MRRKRGTILTLLLLAAAILSQSLITPSAGLDYPAIYIDPATIGPAGHGVGTIFNISIWTNYTGSDIWGWRFTLTYNPLVLNGTGVFNGNLTTDPPHPAAFQAGNFTEYTGELSATEGSFQVDALATPPTNVTTGPGILATVTFKVVGLGDSDIKLGDETKLIGYSGGGFYDIVDALLMPGNIGHSYFRNVGVPTHDIAVISVEPNVTKVLAPASVGINVTVKNNGTADERFAVEVYYDVISADFLIGSTDVDNLTAGASWSNVFTWDTTYVTQDNQTIIAKAGPVARETDTADNQNEASVNVYSPCIKVVPESEINPDLTAGQNHTVSIYTDYNATEVKGSNNTWGYELTLTYNASILQGLVVTNGGTMPQYDSWVGNNNETQYNATVTPIVPGSETVTYNGTTMNTPADYVINYATGNITFTTAPGWALIEVEYQYAMSLMPGAVFSTQGFDNVNGKLKLTKANFTGLVSGPGVLATVIFSVAAVGESDITLGNETVLIGSGSLFNITMVHRLEEGYFTNQGDAAVLKCDVDQPGIEVYPTALWTFNVTVQVQNIDGAPNFTIVVYYTVGPTDYTLATYAITNLAEAGKQTVKILANMSGAPFGEHIISAKVVVPAGDHNELNDYTDSGDVVKATLLGDMDGDDYVGPIDTSSFLAAYGQYSHQALYKAKADLVPADAPDGYVGPVDLSKFGAQYGEDER